MVSLDNNVSVVVGKVDAVTDPRVAVIRTSDRNSFLMCRRKWNWTSHMRLNLGPIQVGNPLWLGSGIHYALEDFHGHKLYSTPAIAFQAFIKAYQTKYPRKVPDDWQELGQLGVSMMEYYPIWLIGRDPLETYVVDNAFQNEVGIRITIPWELIEAKCDKERYARIRAAYDVCMYSLTLDRVSIDEHGQLWIVEYKTAKAMSVNHFMNDAQISTYMWGANVVYDKPLAGVIYQQHKKTLPKEPKLLQNGTFSVAANQSVSHRSYRNALIKHYGEVKKAPGANIKYLNSLAAEESADGDNFIRRDKVTRNKHAAYAVSQQIIYQAIDMMDPELPLYPAPSRNCAIMCGMMSPCISIDDGSDYESEIAQGYEKRPTEYDLWRDKLPDPATFKGVKLSTTTAMIL